MADDCNICTDPDLAADDFGYGGPPNHCCWCGDVEPPGGGDYCDDGDRCGQNPAA